MAIPEEIRASVYVKKKITAPLHILHRDKDRSGSQEQGSPFLSVFHQKYFDEGASPSAFDKETLYCKNLKKIFELTHAAFLNSQHVEEGKLTP